MVVVEVQDPKTKKIYEYYLDEKIKKQIDEKVKPSLEKKDEDYCILIDGRERQGKSVFGFQIGRYIDPSLSLNRICFSSDEFRKAILNAKKGQVVIFDEAYRGFGSTSALSEVNKILRAMMMEMGQKNLCVIIILPTFYLLEKYVALWRTRVLIHIRRKGYFSCFNARKKQELYLNPIGKRNYSYSHVKTGFKGRFYGKYAIDEQQYRKKKAEAFQLEFKKTKYEKYMEQRDKLISYIFKKGNLSLRGLETEMKDAGVQLKKSILDNIVRKYRDRS